MLHLLVYIGIAALTLTVITSLGDRFASFLGLDCQLILIFLLSGYKLRKYVLMALLPLVYVLPSVREMYFPGPSTLTAGLPKVRPGSGL